VKFVAPDGVTYPAEVTHIWSARCVNLKYTVGDEEKAASSVMHGSYFPGATVNCWLETGDLWYQWTAPSPAKIKDGIYPLATLERPTGVIAQIYRDGDEFKVATLGKPGQPFADDPALLEDGDVQTVISWLRDGGNQPI
jgi:hypothetical protein